MTELERIRWMVTQRGPINDFFLTNVSWLQHQVRIDRAHIRTLLGIIDAPPLAASEFTQELQ